MGTVVNLATMRARCERAGAGIVGKGQTSRMGLHRRRTRLLPSASTMNPLIRNPMGDADSYPLASEHDPNRFARRS